MKNSICLFLVVLLVFLSFPAYAFNKECIEVGSYPQALVTDEALISQLCAEDWSYFENYNDTSDGAEYCDVSYEGEKYRAVKINKYRPLNISEDNGDELHFQEDVVLNKVYWFKWEPLTWSYVSDGVYICDKIIDSQPSEYMLSAPFTGYSLEITLPDISMIGKIKKLTVSSTAYSRALGLYYYDYVDYNACWQLSDNRLYVPYSSSVNAISSDMTIYGVRPLIKVNTTPSVNIIGKKNIIAFGYGSTVTYHASVENTPTSQLFWYVQLDDDSGVSYKDDGSCSFTVENVTGSFNVTAYLTEDGQTVAVEDCARAYVFHSIIAKLIYRIQKLLNIVPVVDYGV